MREKVQINFCELNHKLILYFELT